MSGAVRKETTTNVVLGNTKEFMRMARFSSALVTAGFIGALKGAISGAFDGAIKNGAKAVEKNTMPYRWNVSPRPTHNVSSVMGAVAGTAATIAAPFILASTFNAITGAGEDVISPKLEGKIVVLEESSQSLSNVQDTSSQCPTKVLILPAH